MAHILSDTPGRTGRPCERCNGSGTEPAALDMALAALGTVIFEAQVIGGLKSPLDLAAARVRDAAYDRIGSLESVLDEVLGRLGDGSHGGDCTIMQVPVAEVEAWRERRAG